MSKMLTTAYGKLMTKKKSIKIYNGVKNLV